MPNLIRFLAPVAVLVGLSTAAAAYPASVTSDLNMRAGPGTGHRVVMVLPRGTTVDVRSCASNWCNVVAGGRSGYVSQRFLAARQARALPPAPPPVVEIVPPWQERPRRQARFRCDERDADWGIGERASRRTVELLREDAGARTVRVVRPDDIYTMEFLRDRLTIEVNRRNVIEDLHCG